MAGPDVLAVTLVTEGDPGRLSGGFLYHRRVAALAPQHRASVRFHSLPAWPFPAAIAAGPALLRAVRADAPDVVVLDSIAAAYVAPWRGRLAVPVVPLLHQPPGGIDHGPLRTTLQRRLDLRAYAGLPRILVASEALAAEVRALGIPPDRLRVVAPGRDPVAPRPGAVGDLRRGRQAAVLTVANWLPRKGILDVLGALAALPDGVATLHLVGDRDVDPGYRHAVDARLADPALAGRVVVHGAIAQDELAALYRAADVFLLASTVEPFGTAYAEAMSAGLPVVGWAAGNLPHLARDGVEGVVVPTGDLAALAAALAALAADEPRRLAMGRAAADRAATLPTWDDTARLLFAELRAAAADAARHARRLGSPA